MLDIIWCWLKKIKNEGVYDMSVLVGDSWKTNKFTILLLTIYK